MEDDPRKDGSKNKNSRKVKSKIGEEIVPEPLAALNESTSRVQILRKFVNAVAKLVIFE